MIYNIYMKRVFSEIEIEQIILMAWGDTITFETIRREYGLTENNLRKFIRTHQSPKTYRRWRQRMTERNKKNSKHELLSTITSRRQKFSI
jgi:uncharacterized protein (TIGR03643 family)